MKVDHQKLEKIIERMLDDVSKVFSSSQVSIGTVNGALIRIEVLDAVEACWADEVEDANRCIED